MERPEAVDGDGGTDHRFDALADVYRRRLLVGLLDHNPQDDGDDQTPAGVPVSDAESELLQAEMFHRHLPKLEDLGFIEWDRAADEIATGPRFEEVRPLLALLVRHRDELPEDWL